MILVLEFPIDTSEDDVKDIKIAVWFDSVPASEISQKLMTQAAVDENSEEGSDTALGHEYVPGCTQQEHLVTSQLPSALGGSEPVLHVFNEPPTLLFFGQLLPGAVGHHAVVSNVDEEHTNH